MSKRAELEKSLLGRYSLITITGSDEIMIEGIRGILDYSGESLRANTVSGIVAVMGRGLEISYFTAEEVVLKGKILSVEFCM